MRNLKKVISLAMALTMLIGIMTISAGAISFNDYTDKDTIVHTDAVAMLTELNIIKGTDTGAFNPTGAVTRAAMAKMICVALNRGVDNGSAFVGAAASFSDTDGMWAEGYIEYCAALDVIAGDGTGKFNPNASVTGTQASKMLLVALGYDAVKEGLVGAGWELKTTVLASTLGFYEDIDTLPTATFSRDDAAQLVYNALFANTVGYSVTTGALVTNTTTFAQERFGLITVTGILKSNEYASLTGVTTVKAGYSYIDLEDITTDDGTGTMIKVSTDLSLLGQEVQIFVKGSWNTTGTTLSVTKVYGTAAATDTNVVKTSTAAMAAGSTAWKTFYGYSTGYVFTNSSEDVHSYWNYMADGGLESYANPAGNKVTLVDNDGDKVYEYMFVMNYMFDVVEKVSTTAGITTIDTAYTSFTTDDIVGVTDLAKGDCINVAYVDGLYYVELADSVTGVLNSFVTDTTLTVGGVSYKISNSPVYGDDITAAIDYDSASNIGATGVFYFDPFGNVVATSAVAVSKDYAVVKASAQGSTLDLDRVQLVKTDGTVATYYVNANSTLQVTADTGSGSLIDMVVTYAIQADGSVKLTSAGAYTLVNDTVIAAKQTTYAASLFDATQPSTSYANSSTVYVFYGTSTIGVVTGVTNAGTFTDTASKPVSVVIPTTSGTSVVKFVFVRDATSGATTSAKYAYVTSAAPTVTVESSTTYYTYKAAVGGAIVDLKTTQSSLTVDPYTYTTNTSGVSTLTTPSTTHFTGTVSYVDASYVVIGGTAYTMDSYTVIYDVTTAGAGAVATLDADQVVSVVLDSSNVVDVIYITTQS